MGACGKPPSSSDHVRGLPSPWEDHADVTCPRSRCLLLSQGSVPWQQPWCRVQGWGGHGDMQDEGTLVDGSVPRPPAGLTHWSPGRRQLSIACGSVSSPDRLSPVATLARRAAREEGLSWAKPGWCKEGVLGSQGASCASLLSPALTHPSAQTWQPHVSREERAGNSMGAQGQLGASAPTSLCRAVQEVPTTFHRLSWS